MLWTRVAVLLSLVSLAFGFAPGAVARAGGKRCGPLLASLDAAKEARLAKLDTPSWSKGLRAMSHSVPAAVLPIPEALATFKGAPATTEHEVISLEDTFSSEFAECFHSSAEFRNDLIGCASDVGSLFSQGTPWADFAPDFDEERCRKHLESVLELHLGAAAPTADEFVRATSALCGDGFYWGSFTSFETTSPPGGVQMGEVEGNLFRRVAELEVGALEWHQDWAAAEMAHMFGASRTVMFAFPAAGSSDHEGTGLFTELVCLTHEFSSETLKGTSSYHGLTTANADRKAAAELGVSEEHIVRPDYRRGQEILRYKDSEHLHRSPRSVSDPAGRKRQAIWRFQ